MLLKVGALSHEDRGARAGERREGQDGGLAAGRVELGAQGSIPEVEHPAPDDGLLERGMVPTRKRASAVSGPAPW